jgi:hypothetical protein
MFVTNYCIQNMFIKLIHTDNFLHALVCTSNVLLSVANSDLEARFRGREYSAFQLPFCLIDFWIKILYWSLLFLFLYVCSLCLLQF